MSGALEPVAGFGMGFFGSVPVAGPVALLVLTRGLEGDVRGGIRISLGAACAEGLLSGLVFGGLGVALEAVGGMRSAMDVVGVVVLLGIGGFFALRGVQSAQSQGAVGAPPRVGQGDALLGLGMVLGNPGMIGTWGGAVAALEGTGVVQASAARAPLFGLGVTLGVFAWFWLLLLALERWREVLTGRILDVAVR